MKLLCVSSHSCMKSAIIISNFLLSLTIVFITTLSCAMQQPIPQSKRIDEAIMLSRMLAHDNDQEAFRHILYKAFNRKNITSAFAEKSITNRNRRSSFPAAIDSTPCIIITNPDSRAVDSPIIRPRSDSELSEHSKSELVQWGIHELIEQHNSHEHTNKCQKVAIATLGILSMGLSISLVVSEIIKVWQ